MSRKAIPLLLALTIGPLSFGWEANAVGVGQMCGGLAGRPSCDAGLWCDPEPGKCGVADVQGKCIKVPDACTKDIKPVCGCGNKRFGNDCERQMAKVPKDHDGDCK